MLKYMGFMFCFCWYGIELGIENLGFPLVLVSTTKFLVL